MHYDAFPHRGFPAIPHAALKAASAGARSPGGDFKPGHLTQACFSQLKTHVAAFKRWAGRGGVTITLWGGDALRLCVTKLSAVAFDVIDTSNLVDNVGLLNILAAVGPRLKPRPLSRLYTETMTWESATNSVQEFVHRALGAVPPSIFPTLFGLRLLTDFELGSSYLPPLVPQPRRTIEPRAMEWCPAVFADDPDTVSSTCSVNQLPTVPRHVCTCCQLSLPAQHPAVVAVADHHKRQICSLQWDCLRDHA